MGLTRLEWLLVVLYWLLMAPTIFLICLKSVKWDRLALGTCVGITMAMALLLAVCSWTILMLLAAVYFKVKASCSHSQDSHTNRTQLSQPAPLEPSSTVRRATRPAPSLPLKSRPPAAAMKAQQTHIAYSPPPTYEESLFAKSEAE